MLDGKHEGASQEDINSKRKMRSIFVILCLLTFAQAVFARRRFFVSLFCEGAEPQTLAPFKKDSGDNDGAINVRIRYTGSCSMRTYRCTDPPFNQWPEWKVCVIRRFNCQPGGRVRVQAMYSGESGWENQASCPNGAEGVGSLMLARQ